MRSTDWGARAQAGSDYTVLTTSTLPTLMVSGPSVSTVWPLTAMLVRSLIIRTPFSRFWGDALTWTLRVSTPRMMTLLKPHSAQI